MDDDDDESSEDEEEEKPENKTLQQSAVDITEAFIKERLEPPLVTALVMRALPRIPSEIPAQFCNSYTPIDAAGTESQIKHVSRLLAAQMTAAGIGPGVQEAIMEQERQSAAKADSDDEDKRPSTRSNAHISVIGGAPIDEIRSRKDKVMLMPAGLVKKSSSRRALKLSDITKSLSTEEKSSLMLKATQRILNAEKAATNGGIPVMRTKIISTIGARFQATTKSAIGEHFHDISCISLLFLITII